MIKYALVCESGHEFESWFPDSAAFDRLARRGQVECPRCGSPRVRKAVMAPSVARRDRGAAEAGEARPAAVALLDEKQSRLRALLREARREMIASSEDVGDRFVEEARAIHEGLAPAKAIRGEAKPEEARALIEDGVPILPIPTLPDERH